MKKADDPHVKALQSIDKQELLKKLKKIFGGADIDFYTDKAYGVIEESNKGAKTYEEFIVGRTYIIFQMFKENKVNMDIKELSKEKIASMAEKNYQDSIVNFVKIVFKNMETTINLLINGSLTLFGVALGHYVTKHTHIFQRSYERKSDLIIDPYKEVVRLEFALKKYVHFTGAETGQDSIERKIEELNNIKKTSRLFSTNFGR